MKRSFIGLAIFGILLIFFGTGFALQGDGILPGSAMSGVSFWLYAGSVIAILGVVLAALGFVMGSRKKPMIAEKQKAPGQP